MPSPIVCSRPCATLDLGDKEYAHPGKKGEEKESMRKLREIPSFMKRKLKSSPVVLSQFLKCCVSDLLEVLRTELFFFFFIFPMAKIYYHDKIKKRKRCLSKVGGNQLTVSKSPLTVEQLYYSSNQLRHHSKVLFAGTAHQQLGA